MTQRFPKIDRNFMIESATNKVHSIGERLIKAGAKLKEPIDILWQSGPEIEHRETDDVLRITCGAVDKSDKIAGRKGWSVGGLCTERAEFGRGALTYCDGQARGESAPGSHNSTSACVRLILAHLAPSLEPVDSILVLMVVLLVPKVVRCGALLSPGVQPTLSHGQRSGV